jgi:hypothetical protein
LLNEARRLHGLGWSTEDIMSVLAVQPPGRVMTS